MAEKKIEDKENKIREISKIADEAQKYFESPEFINSPSIMEKRINTLSPEKLLKSMTI